MARNLSGSACQPQKNLPDDNLDFTLEDLDYLDTVILPHEKSFSVPQAMVDSINRDEVAMFCKLLRERLLDTSKPFSKEYLQLLGDRAGWR